MVRAPVAVFIVGLAQLLSSVCDQGDGNQEQDEWPADASRVGDKNLRVAFKHNDNNDGEGEDDSPDALDRSLVVIQEELAATTLTDPALDRDDLHEVVSQSDE